ncbi:MAG TPA: hypothetical protein VGI23_05520 [Steroidobacteraceae bacterium]
MSYGPWNPGLNSQVPRELRHMCTIFRPENSFTRVASALELRQLTGLPLCDLATLRPQRLVLHELMIRVMADLSVPTGEKIGDLGINFRIITNRLLHRYIEPEMESIAAEYASVREQLATVIRATLSELTAPPPAPKTGWLRRPPKQPQPSAADWGPQQITACERLANNTDDPLKRAAYRALVRVMSALFTTNGRSWGTPELICSLATDLACNDHGSEIVGRTIEPLLRKGIEAEKYELLPRQDKPIIINTKGPSASGKSSLRPLHRKLAGALGVRWADFALISPDIFRKQLLDYSGLGSAYKYAGAFTSEELQIVDQKLDRYMARKHAQGSMAHLLIDRFRFDSFAPDSDEAGSNLLTRFGDYVYLFFVITPPEQLVERAWMRGLEFGRYKAVDDTLAHCVEAYVGVPNVFFTWVHRTDKQMRIEFLDNSVAYGALPKTVAFGDNYTFNVLDVDKLLDIERFGRVDVDATAPDKLYADPALLAPEHNLGFLRRCIQVFREVNFADQKSGRIYLRIRSGVAAQIDRSMPQSPVLQSIVAKGTPEAINQPLYLEDTATLGDWG